MAEADSLTLAYLGAHPKEAARVLDGLAPAQVAALWVELPARLVAPCAAAMRPSAAGAALLQLDDDTAVALLAALKPATTAALLRPLRSARVTAWLHRLPAASALATQALLRFPADAVGAVTDTGVLAFAPDTTVGQALQVLQAAEQAQDLVLVDGGPGARGVVPVGSLLMAHPQDKLLRWSQPQPALPALMPAEAALLTDGWLDGLRRPVVEADGRLLGLVSQQALQRVHSAQLAPAPADALGWLGQSYWQALAALAEGLCGLSGLVRSPPSEARRP